MQLMLRQTRAELPRAVRLTLHQVAAGRGEAVVGLLAELVTDPHAWEPLRSIVLEPFNEAVAGAVLAELHVPQALEGLSIEWRRCLPVVQRGSSGVVLHYAVRLALTWPTSTSILDAGGQLTTELDVANAWEHLRL